MPYLTLLPFILLTGIATALLELTRHALRPHFQPVRIKDDPVEPVQN